MKNCGTGVFDPRVLNFRASFNRSLRKYFEENKFLEVETPILINTNTPDPNIDPVMCRSLYGGSGQLHTSPEIWLKRALSLSGVNIYQLAKVFRDDRPSASHAREFSMLEWYRTNASLNDLLRDCQAIFQLAHKNAQTELSIDLPAIEPFLYYDIDLLFAELAQIDLPMVLSAINSGNKALLQEILTKRGERLPPQASFEDAFFHIMLKYVEPQLPKNHPSVICRWPLQLAALSEACADNPLYCERFEIYFRGLEIANAYQECRDPEVLTRRFDLENNERKRLDKPIFALDNNLINALVGQPPIAGIALGVDRLLLGVSQKDHLKQIIFGFQEDLSIKDC